MKGGQAGSLWRAISFVVNETEPAPRLSKENAVSHALIRLFFLLFFFLYRVYLEENCRDCVCMHAGSPASNQGKINKSLMFPEETPMSTCLSI